MVSLLVGQWDSFQCEAAPFAAHRCPASMGEPQNQYLRFVVPRARQLTKIRMEVLQLRGEGRRQFHNFIAIYRVKKDGRDRLNGQPQPLRHDPHRLDS